MIARRYHYRTEDGEAGLDYVRAELVRAAKRKARSPLTPAEEIELRDLVWAILANQGLSTYEIERACARAAQSERHIRRRLAEWASQGHAVGAG